MKPTNLDSHVQPPEQPASPLASLPLRAKHILGLRPKFVLFFSLILIVVCSTLSVYYVEARREGRTSLNNSRLWQEKKPSRLHTVL